MAFDARCPSCGGSTKIESPFAKTAVCAQCGATLWLLREGVKAGPKMTAPTPALSGLFLGAEGVLRGGKFRVVGRLRYAYARGFWDEWFLSVGDRLVWLSEDEGELSFEKEYSFKGKLPAYSMVRTGQALDLSGHPFTVEEKGLAVLESGEGELPFVVTPGEKTPYIEGSVGARMATVEYDKDGPKLYVGEWVPMKDLQLDEASSAAAAAAKEKAAPSKAKAFPCPSCGGSLTLKLAGEAEMIVCQYCASALDLRSEKHQVLGKMVHAGPKGGALRVGLKGSLRGTTWEIVGRLRYRDTTP